MVANTGATRSGHRARLRQRFIVGGPRAFLDHEILEMLLAQVDLRRDTKARAYGLIDAFEPPSAPESIRPALGQKLAPVLVQPPDILAGGTVAGVGPAMALHLSAIRSAAMRIAEAGLMEAPVLANWEAAVGYCNLRFAGNADNGVHVLFLDFRHRLMREPATCDPTSDPDEFVRSVIELALRRAASGLIVVRHHPHAPASPQSADFKRADKLKEAPCLNAISVHDYMLVSPSGHLSLRSMGMLEVAPPDYMADPAEQAEPLEDDTDGWFTAQGETLDQLQRRTYVDGAGRLSDVSLLAMLLRRTVGDEYRVAFAEQLIAEFAGLGRLFSAPLEEVAAALFMVPEPMRPETSNVLAVHLGVIAEATQRLLRGQVLALPLLDNNNALASYCRAALGYQEVEQFRVLFLDRRHHLMWDEIISKGTVNHAPVQPREVTARALRLKASALVLVHNHPTGEPEPSQTDIDTTRQIVEACRVIGVDVVDHLIIAQSGHTSLTEIGRMPGRLKAVKTRGRPPKRQQKLA